MIHLSEKGADYLGRVRALGPAIDAECVATSRRGERRFAGGAVGE